MISGRLVPHFIQFGGHTMIRRKATLGTMPVTQSVVIGPYFVTVHLKYRIACSLYYTHS